MRRQPSVELGFGSLPVGFHQIGFGGCHLGRDVWGGCGNGDLRRWCLSRILGEPGNGGEQKNTKSETKHGIPHLTVYRGGWVFDARGQRKAAETCRTAQYCAGRGLKVTTGENHNDEEI
jgi:hypothetical protein